MDVYETKLVTFRQTILRQSRRWIGRDLRSAFEVHGTSTERGLSRRSPESGSRVRVVRHPSDGVYSTLTEWVFGSLLLFTLRDSPFLTPFSRVLRSPGWSGKRRDPL